MISLLLIGVYAHGLRASLRTQREAFVAPVEEPRWSRRRASLVLAASGALVAVASDTLVGSVEHPPARSVSRSSSSARSSWPSSATPPSTTSPSSPPLKDQIDLTLSIAVGSAAQVGLLLAPLVALASLVIGPARMPLVFNGYELAALLAAGWLTAAMTSDGVSTRARGAGLLGAYTALGVTFLFA